MKRQQPTMGATTAVVVEAAPAAAAPSQPANKSSVDAIGGLVVTTLLGVGVTTLIVLKSNRSFTLVDAWDAIASAATAVAASDAVKHAVVITEWLEGAAFSLGSIPVSVLDLCGSVLVCYGYRHWLQHASANGTKHRKSWFESLVACTLMQFGGTTLTGLVLGQTPSWIVSHSAYPALLLAWYDPRLASLVYIDTLLHIYVRSA